jgi:L-cysteine desulfidase
MSFPTPGAANMMIHEGIADPPQFDVKTRVCTEPIAVAYAAALAAAQLKGEVQEVRIVVDPGVFKNGFAVTVPNTGGEKGNLIAGALGALIARPELKMEILKGSNDALLAQAKGLLAKRQVTLTYDKRKACLSIDVTVKSASGTARAVLEGGHTNLVRLEKDGTFIVDDAASGPSGKGNAYRERLREMTIAGMIDLVDALHGEDLAYLRQGVEMNLALAEAGRNLGKVGHFVADLVSEGLLVDDVISRARS